MDDPYNKDAPLVLLVDDDPDIRAALTEQLRLHEEFATIEAATAREALEAARNEYFDAILLDVGLPERGDDGSEYDPQRSECHKSVTGPHEPSPGAMPNSFSSMLSKPSMSSSNFVSRYCSMPESTCSISEDSISRTFRPTGEP